MCSQDAGNRINKTVIRRMTIHFERYRRSHHALNREVTRRAHCEVGADHLSVREPSRLV